MADGLRPWVFTPEEGAALRDADTAYELNAAARRLCARVTAEALEEAAANPTATLWDDTIKRGVAAVSVTDLRVLAAEYRKGRR